MADLSRTRIAGVLVGLALTSNAAAAVSFSGRAYQNLTGSAVMQSVSGDFNNDGHPDVVSFSNHYLAYYECTGDGTLRSPVLNYIATNTNMFGSGTAAAADFDGDGNLDVALGVGYRLNIGTGVIVGVIAVYSGDGSGHFAPGTTKLTSGSPHLVAGDFDADGNADLADAAGSVVIYLGNGDGTFQPPMLLPFSLGSVVRVGNVDNSGGNDLISASPLGDVVVLRDAGLTGATPQFVPGAVDWEFPSLAVGDLDNDGNPDLVVGSWSNNYGSFRGSVKTFLGNGQGEFTFHSQAFGGVGVEVADFDTDGNLDVVTGSGSSRGISVLLGDGAGGLSTRFDNLFAETGSFLIDDFNRDGRPDYAVWNLQSANAVTVWINASTWGCADSLVLDYSAGTLTLGFTIKTVVPALWSTWIVWDGGAAPLWSTEIPPVQPAVSFTVPIPNVPPLGNIAILTALSHPTLGPMCGDFKIVDTGAANGRSR